ncbi:hypothetical protein OAL14_00880 [Gammaproteobacteria bacterium]|nr:hypothetical protein [Gammaproteobacteria bacterium]
MRSAAIYAGLGLSLAFTSGTADSYLLRNAQDSLTQGEIRFHGEYTTFDESLDLLNFASKIEGSTKPEDANIGLLGLAYGFNDKYALSYQFESNDGKATRATEPLDLDTEIQGHSLELSINIGTLRERKSVLHIGLGTRDQDNLTIDCYQTRNIVLGGSCESADFRILDGDHFEATGESQYYPVLATEGSEESFHIAMTLQNQRSDRFQVTQEFGFKRAKLDVPFESKLTTIESPFLLNSSYRGYSLRDTIDFIKQDLPQTTPWYENSLNYSVSGKWLISDRFSANLSISHYYIKRSDYEPNPAKKDFNHNSVLDGSIWYEPKDAFSIYLRAQLTSNYLLGLDALSYNRKSNRLFDYPYGQLSIGLVGYIRGAKPKN